MPSYPAKITEGEEGLVLVTFPDVPEAVVCAEGERAALERAPEILDSVLAGYEAEQRPIPQPSDDEEGPRVRRRRFDPARSLG
ncbi:MAG TPA: type II toxin-antitoxin system HicB family antitoxin [Allosphingosinicella sp.]|nr:type II toxin-antitoxin system HicB family antitoxin [Allosphingosinicella sp.]